MVYDDSLANLYGPFFTVFVIFYLIIGFLYLTLYVLGALGLSRLAKNRGMTNGFWAWIPYARFWLLGAVADNIGECTSRITHWRTIMIALVAGSLATKLISQVTTLTMDTYSLVSSSASAINTTGFWLPLLLVYGIELLFTILSLVVYYKIFSDYSQSAAVMTVAAFFGLAPVCLFLIRHNPPYSMGIFPGPAAYPLEYFPHGYPPPGVYSPGNGSAPY